MNNKITVLGMELEIPHPTKDDALPIAYLQSEDVLDSYVDSLCRSARAQAKEELGIALTLGEQTVLFNERDAQITLFDIIDQIGTLVYDIKDKNLNEHMCIVSDVCSFDADPEYADGWMNGYKFCDTNPLRTSWFYLDYNIVPGAKFWLELTPVNSTRFYFDLKKAYLLSKVACRQSGTEYVDALVYEAEVASMWAASKSKLDGKPLQQQEVQDGYAYKQTYDSQIVDIYAFDKYRQENYPMDRSLHLTCKTFQGL